MLLGGSLTAPRNVDVTIRDKKKKKGARVHIGRPAADHLSRLENPHQDKLENKEITETFPLETLGISVVFMLISNPDHGLTDLCKIPMLGREGISLNFHCSRMYLQLKKSFSKMSNTLMDDPFLFSKYRADHVCMIRVPVSCVEHIFAMTVLPKNGHVNIWSHSSSLSTLKYARSGPIYIVLSFLMMATVELFKISGSKHQVNGIVSSTTLERDIPALDTPTRMSRIEFFEVSRARVFDLQIHKCFTIPQLLFAIPDI
ncbi:hypothetical protein Tco_1360719 [Tanacetum coccineum]